MAMDWFGTPMQPMPGGHSGETFLVGHNGDAVVLRIYHRHPERLLVDVSLLRLMDGVLPVPHIVEMRPADRDRPGVLVTARLPGERLDLVLGRCNTDLRRTLGRALGGVLAALSGIPMLAAGFFAGRTLRIESRDFPDRLGLWAQAFREQGSLAGWAPGDFDRLTGLIDSAAELFMGPNGSWSNEDPGPALRRHVLVHGDLNPKNVLVDPERGEVTGVLDWEFSHAGSPYADIGNLTRFERHPDFVSQVLDTFIAQAPALADDPLTLGRAADLWALVELAGRPGRNAVQELATTLLLAQARTQDLHAWPWPTPRVDPAPLAP